MARLIIFDFDGTLADTVRDIATALTRTLAAAGLPDAAVAEVRSWIGTGPRRLIEQAVPDDQRSPDRVAELTAAFRAHYAECCTDTTTLYPGMAECLDALAADTLAILSNKPADFLLPIVERLGIAGRFAAIVGGDTLPVKKPDPETVRHVVRAVGGREEVWMVGDSAIDVAAARAAGARTIGCVWGYCDPAELRAAGAELIAERPSEIPQLLAATAAAADGAPRDGLAGPAGPPGYSSGSSSTSGARIQTIMPPSAPEASGRRSQRRT